VARRLGGERVKEEAGVCIRGTGVEHQSGVLADDSAQRGPVRLRRRQPVHVVADPLQAAHFDTVVRGVQRMPPLPGPLLLGTDRRFAEDESVAEQDGPGG
jgi:hypothetical protein